MTKRLTSMLAIYVTISAVSLCQAVRTQYWQESESKDFKAGKTQNLVISNFGQLKLGPEQTTLLQNRTDVNLVFEVRRLSDGSIIAATGPEGKLLIYKNGKWSVLFKADQPYIFSIEIGQSGNIYIGTGGAKGKIYQLNVSDKEKKAKLIFENKDVNYIWKLKLTNDNALLAATGPKGKLFRITPKKTECIFKCKQNNLLSLAIASDNKIYVGTDKNGIIYEISKDKKEGKYKSRALYDANEPEISAITITDDGIIYIATASGRQSKGQARAYLKKPAGHPITKSKNSDAKRKNKTKTHNDKSNNIKTDEPPKQMPFQMPPELKNLQLGKLPPASKPSRGNAVYRIDSLGFVSEVFRDKVDILSMIEKNGKLFLGTAPDGIIYQINPENEEIVVYAKTQSDSVMDLTTDKSGQIIAAMANAAKIIKFGPKLAKQGIYTSKAFDGKQICLWGKVTISPKQTNENATIKIQTRSSAISDPDQPGWSDWQSIIDGGRIISPSARFLQYRILFESDGNATPIVDSVKIAYMQNNLPPELSAVIINTGHNSKTSKMPQMVNIPKSARSAKYKISWKARDPNNDKLHFDIYLKHIDTPYWIPIKKDYTQQMLSWDPTTVPDGKYQIKVVASDALDNPAGMGKSASRISDEFIVDNTPAIIKNLQCKIIASKAEKKQLLIQANLIDSMSEIADAKITINSSKDWQYIAPADEIYDSKSEYIETLVPLKNDIREPILISLKVQDRFGNVSYAWQIIKPEQHIQTTTQTQTSPNQKQ